MLITADGGYRRGSLLPLKHDADYALRETPSIEHVVVVKRGDFPLHVREGRDHWYHRLMQDASAWCEPAAMDANDPLFILYTSGTTGKPKGIVHGTGGYLTGTYATTRWVFDLREDDVFWCTADIGWITGHSYVVYGPLAAGATVVLYEGAPDWPDRDRFWEICERYGVIGLLHGADGDPRLHEVGRRTGRPGHDLSRLRLLGTVGEPINPEAWTWYHTTIGGGRCPIVDTWWQTETGSDPDHAASRPDGDQAGLGHATLSRGSSAEILTERGETVAVGGGYLALRAAVAGAHARDLGRPGALRRRRTGAAGIATPTSPATAPSATRTATSGSSGAWTT